MDKNILKDFLDLKEDFKRKDLSLDACKKNEIIANKK